MKIVVTDHLLGQVEQEKSIAESFGHTLEEHQCIDEHETCNAFANANIVFNNLAPINKSALQNMAKDAVVIRYGVGIDNVDTVAASELGISVCNVPDYGTAEVRLYAIVMWCMAVITWAGESWYTQKEIFQF